MIDSWFDTDTGFLSIPSAFEDGGCTMGGGIGVVKLSSGGYLLVVTGPGGNDDDPHTDFFFLLGRQDADGTALSTLGTVSGSGEYDLEIVPLGRWWNADADNGFESSEKQFQWSENITVIPSVERGTSTS